MWHTVQEGAMPDTVTREIVEKLRLELRRGALPLAVLAQLRREHYGYSLRRELNELGLDIDEGTLYPLVRRLETQGLLLSEWRQDEARQKRFYRITPLGRQVLALLVGEWQSLNTSVERIIEEQ